MVKIDRRGLKFRRLCTKFARPCCEENCCLQMDSKNEERDNIFFKEGRDDIKDDDCSGRPEL